jgi:glycosyltransferase involved in cell wall biosynthesis/2-polyprenyl-3-methyl-5-hydroxy-6-metoxy-1,4-benzoquinol methylase
MHGVSERRPLRIVSVQTSGEQGGAEYANVEVLSGLQARGLDVTLLSNQPGLAAGTEVPVVEIELGPKIGRRTLRRVALNFPRWLWRLRRALQREARRAPIDVLLVHFKKEQLMSALLPRRLTGAVVWAEWGRLPEAISDGPARWVYLAAARRAQLIVAVSESTRRSLVDAGVPAAKVVVIHNIVDGHEVVFDAQARTRYRREWGVGDGTFVLGCISRLNASKRNDVIVDALAHLPEEVLLVLAGDGDDEPALRARAAPYGDRVRFLPTPRGYVQEVLSACDVAVFAPQQLEGAPRSIIFGQLSGRAVVASGPEGADGMILAGTGTIVEPAHDPRALAACLEEYRLDPARREREGAAGRALAAERYDSQAVVGEWVARLGALAADVDRCTSSSTAGAPAAAAGFDRERSEREREAYDEHDVEGAMNTWHGRFPHVFQSPNTRRAEERFDALTRAAVAGRNVLDMGCGDGESSARLLELGAAHVLGVDISRTAIDRALARAQPGRLDFRLGDVTLEIEGTFDCVFGRSILHHIDYRALLVRLYEERLTPGGTMLFMEPQGENGLIRLYTRLVAAAHTPDEQSFMEDDIAWLRSHFAEIELYPVNYLTFPAAILSSRLPLDADNVLLRACDRADEWLAGHVPRLRTRFRQTIVAIRKPA